MGSRARAFRTAAGDVRSLRARSGWALVRRGGPGGLALGLPAQEGWAIWVARVRVSAVEGVERRQSPGFDP